MGSFTDQVTQYNPYVDTLNSNALIGVEQQKQQLYNQGYERIQGDFNSLLGLDIAKPEDQQYIQTKLSGIKDSLSKNTNGDFSDQRLLSQVGGYTAKIAGDPNVKTAMLSTAYYRQGQQAADAERKAGKGNDANAYVFQKQASQWLNDRTAGSAFTGQYTPYQDTTKKLNDAANEWIKNAKDIKIDNPFKRDDQGNTLKDANGKPIVDMDMLRETIAGLSPDQLYKKFNGVLNEADQRQLQIDGVYHYRNTDDKGLEAIVDHQFKTQEDNLKTNIQLYQTALVAKKLTPEQRTEASLKVKNFTSQLEDLGKTKADTKAQIYQNPDRDGFKGNLYTESYLHTLAGDMANQSISYERMTNPDFQAAMDLKNLAYKYDDLRTRKEEFNADYKIKEADLGIKKEELKLAQNKDTREAKKAAQEAGDQKVTWNPGLPTDVPVPTIASVNQQIGTKQDQLKALNTTYATVMGLGSDPKIAQNTLDTIYTNWLHDPSSVAIDDNKLLTYLQQRDGLTKSIVTTTRMKSLAQKVYDDTANPAVNGLLKDAPAVTFKGGSVMYTPQQLLDFSQKRSGYAHYTPSVYGMNQTKPTLDADRMMGDFKGTPYEALAKIYVKDNNGEALTPTEQKLMKTVNQVGETYTTKVRPVYKDADKAASNFLAQNMPDYQLTKGVLNPDNKQDMNHVNQIIGMANATFTANNGSLDGVTKSNYDPSMVTGWITGKEKDAVQYLLNKKPDGTASLDITLGGQVQSIPLTAEQAQGHFGDYMTPNPIDAAQKLILSSPDRTTNPIKAREAATAQYHGTSLPLFQNDPQTASRIHYDIEGDPSDQKNFQVRLYWYNDDKKWEDHLLNDKGWITSEGVKNAIQNLGPAKLNELIKQNNH